MSVTHSRIGFCRLAWAVAGVVVLGLVAWTLFWRLGDQVRWIDETTYRAAGWAYVHGDTAPNPEHPPLGKLLLGCWQLVLGTGTVSLRVLMGLLSLATAAVLWWFAAQVAGRRWALLPAVAWLLLLHRAETGGRLDRLVQLDTVMVVLLVAGYAAAWRWWETRRIGPALVAGCFLGAAVATKVTAVLFLPALLVLLPGWGPWRRLSMHVGAFAGAAVVVVVAVLLPFGGLDAVREMVSFQRQHNRAGHLILVGDHVYDHAPWWVTLRYALDGTSWPQAVFLVAGTALAVVVVRPRRLVALLGVGLVVPLVFFMFVSDVALPHYYIDWLWIPTLLTTLAVPALLARGPASRALAAALAVALVVGVAQSVAATRADPPSAIGSAQASVDDGGGGDGVTLVQGLSPAIDVGSYFRSPVADPAYPGITAIVLGDDPRVTVSPALRAWTGALPAGVRELRRADLTIYLLPRPLVMVGGRLSLAAPPDGPG